MELSRRSVIFPDVRRDDLVFRNNSPIYKYSAVAFCNFLLNKRLTRQPVDGIPNWCDYRWSSCVASGCQSSIRANARWSVGQRIGALFRCQRTRAMSIWNYRNSRHLLGQRDAGRLEHVVHWLNDSCRCTSCFSVFLRTHSVFHSLAYYRHWACAKITNWQK